MGQRSDGRVSRVTAGSASMTWADPISSGLVHKLIVFSLFSFWVVPEPSYLYVAIPGHDYVRHDTTHLQP